MSNQYGARDAACPLSTREGGGGHRPRMQKACHASSGCHTISITSPAPLGPASSPGAPPESPVRRSFSLLPRGPLCAAVRPTPCTRRVRLVRGEGHGASD